MHSAVQTAAVTIVTNHDLVCYVHTTLWQLHALSPFGPLLIHITSTENESFTTSPRATYSLIVPHAQ